MPYRIILVGSTKENPVFAIDHTTGDYYEYETGAQAQERAKAMALEGDGQKWRVKRILDTRWKSREQHKFDNGTYDYLPWVGLSWWDYCHNTHRHHFPHPSRQQPGMIAYTESVDKGMDNIQTQIKPGRYLEKYFADALKHYGMNIKEMAQEFERDHKPRPVFFAATEDEIQWVYETGPASCMSNKAHRERHGWGYPVRGKWPLDTHACRVYAAGDLQVAYITHNDTPKGHVEGRSLVWPAKMTHSRCYAKNETVMVENLERLGYTANAPYGAKIQRIPVPDTDLFLCPYVDQGHGPGQGSMALHDKTTHFELGPMEPFTYAANSTSGLSGPKLGRDLRPLVSTRTNCQVCEGHVTDVGELVQVFTSGASGDWQMWCGGCLEPEMYEDEDGETIGAFRCQYDGRWYSSRRVRQHRMFNGQIWSDRAYRANGFLCAATGRKYHAEQRVRMYDSNSWCRDYFYEHGFSCGWTGDHYPKSMGVVLAKGRGMWSVQAFAVHGFTCESCGGNHDRRRKTNRGICEDCCTHERNGEYRILSYKVPHIQEYQPNEY